MIQPRELAPAIGRMIVNGEILEGEKLGDYLQQMPYDDLVSLLEDRARVGFDDYGYPKNWPKCKCGLPALDGRKTCGRVECGGM
jgi:hypothetical protein